MHYTRLSICVCAQLSLNTFIFMIYQHIAVETCNSMAFLSAENITCVSGVIYDPEACNKSAHVRENQS